MVFFVVVCFFIPSIVPGQDLVSQIFIFNCFIFVLLNNMLCCYFFIIKFRYYIEGFVWLVIWSLGAFMREGWHQCVVWVLKTRLDVPWLALNLLCNEEDFALVVLLPSPQEHWIAGMHHYTVQMVPGTEPRLLCMSGEVVLVLGYKLLHVYFLIFSLGVLHLSWPLINLV